MVLLHLPNYRGGAPLVWAMINGEKKTGISMFMMDDGGYRVNCCSEVKISDNDDINTYKKIEDGLVTIDRVLRK